MTEADASLFPGDLSPKLLRAPIFVSIVCTVLLAVWYWDVSPVTVLGMDATAVLVGVIAGSWLLIVGVATVRDAFDVLERDVLGVLIVYCLFLGLYAGSWVGTWIGLSGVAGVVVQVVVSTVALFLFGSFGGIVANMVIGNPRQALPVYLDGVQDRSDRWKTRSREQIGAWQDRAILWLVGGPKDAEETLERMEQELALRAEISDDGASEDADDGQEEDG